MPLQLRTRKSSAAGLGMRYQPNIRASGAHILLSLCEASEEFKESIWERSPASTDSAIGKYLECLWMQIEENVRRLKVTAENSLQITNLMLSFHHTHTHTHSAWRRESKWYLTSYQRFPHHIPLQLYIEPPHSVEKSFSLFGKSENFRTILQL